jgi:hypothetical protein
MATNEIVKQQNTALSEFGGRDEIKELAERLRIMMPNAQKLNDNEARAVAQIAVAHQLDPFNGEVWGIKGEDKWYGVMVGIKGLRRSARREARKNGSDFITSFHKVDPAKYSAKPEEIVYECHLRDTRDFQNWVKMSIDMTVAKMDKDFILSAIGPAPVVIGVGIARSGERSKMELHARAKKRAEADAIKQKYDVSFGPGVVTDADEVKDDIEEVIEASSTDYNEFDNRHDSPDYIEGEAIEPEPAQDEPPAQEAVIDWKQRHTELWHKASKLGLLKLPEAVMKYSAKANETPEQVKEKCYLLNELITQTELGF